MVAPFAVVVAPFAVVVTPLWVVGVAPLDVVGVAPLDVVGVAPLDVVGVAPLDVVVVAPLEVVVAAAGPIPALFAAVKTASPVSFFLTKSKVTLFGVNVIDVCTVPATLVALNGPIAAPAAPVTSPFIFFPNASTLDLLLALFRSAAIYCDANFTV